MKSPNSQKKNNQVSRRSFLKSLGLAGAAVPLVVMTGCGGDNDDEGDDNDPNKVDAFKLSARDTGACNACKKHARFKIFSTAVIADAHRAHAGCKCTVKRVRISAADAQRYFADFPYYDRRKET